MSAVIAALFTEHDTAQRVRTRLVQDGFPTDRVSLTSRQEPGQAQVVPAHSITEKLIQHFRQFFQGPEAEACAQLFARGVLEGHSVIAVQPRGTVETERAFEILRAAGPLELHESDLDNQTMEQAASPSDKPVIPGAEKIVTGPQGKRDAPHGRRA
jgi:hypothetical protein